MTAISFGNQQLLSMVCILFWLPITIIDGNKWFWLPSINIDNIFSGYIWLLSFINGTYASYKAKKLHENIWNKE